jgi:hypothetical protein
MGLDAATPSFHPGSLPIEPSRRYWPRPLIFLHIPKAGGSSLQDYILSHYPGGKFYRFTGDTQQWNEFPNLPEARRASFDALVGHVHFGLHRHLPEPATYLTMLRDPVDRMVSHFYYVLSDPAHYLHKRIREGGYTLYEFAATRVSHELDNDQVRWLTEAHHFEVERVDRALLEQAKWNLEHGIAAFGLMERFEQSLRCFEAAFGWEKRPLIEKKNVNRERPPLAEIDPAAIQAIREANKFDVELYEFARALFEERAARLRVHL